MPALIQKMRRNVWRWTGRGLSRAEKVAQAKRTLERELRAAGLSRAAARREVSARFAVAKNA